MSELDDQFQQATQGASQLSVDPGNDAKLTLYALYKQATSGDVGGQKPGRFDMVGRAKYDAREKVKGLSLDDAKQAYIDFVKGLGG